VIRCVRARWSMGECMGLGAGAPRSVAGAKVLMYIETGERTKLVGRRVCLMRPTLDCRDPLTELSPRPFLLPSARLTLA